MLPSLRPTPWPEKFIAWRQAKAWMTRFPGYKTFFLHRVCKKAWSDGYANCPLEMPYYLSDRAATVTERVSLSHNDQKLNWTEILIEETLTENRHSEEVGGGEIFIHQSRVGLMDDETLIWCFLPPIDQSGWMLTVIDVLIVLTALLPLVSVLRIIFMNVKNYSPRSEV